MHSVQHGHARVYKVFHYAYIYYHSLQQWEGSAVIGEDQYCTG